MKLKGSTLHHHGIDCCWSCSHGEDKHPTDNEDYSCIYELEEYSSAAECARVGIQLVNSED